MKNSFGEKFISVLLVSIISVILLVGCSSKAASNGADTQSAQLSTEESAESPEDSESDTVTESAYADETISMDELKAAFDKAEPYKGEVQVVLHPSSGEDVIVKGADDSKKAGTNYLAASVYNQNRSYNAVAYACATSTLYASGYDYSVWNMLDWDTSTCWAEGDSRSEGLWEGFSYKMDGTNRFDGFRIYPGYQKSKKVYRKNILPLGLQVLVGGNTFYVDLDDCIQNMNSDEDTYWIDCNFSSPVYDDEISVMITAVYTYGSNPDSDCCITEFHPFHY